MLFFFNLQDFLTNKLQLQFEKLLNQARFMKMIVRKELAISNHLS
jgi:DNA topoisomerase-2